MAFTGGPKKVQGKGTAYPVGSPKHDYREQEFEGDGTPEPVFYEVGVEGLPKATADIVLGCKVRDADLVGIVTRTLALDPNRRSVLDRVGGQQFSRVYIEPLLDGDGYDWMIVVEYEL